MYRKKSKIFNVTKTDETNAILLFSLLVISDQHHLQLKKNYNETSRASTKKRILAALCYYRYKTRKIITHIKIYFCRK